ncbi:hypothetical protein E4631_23255 [Hymenobacter sp. UV11]|uniref:hypothetical protein n=1 Tax=Hymenobacter sp. UV11 TaxID=1849735 RepID=UPI00105ED9DA|nr:hypothetical protein [Hymenobacter sp. UV11]TDN39852.1 hypothetical protein A8B98_16810 [Hymenobacter sp. UV11]TFZ63225.1 hypothetical protein E4631_23255 [Hymenobacter sp. UV11]
MKNAVNTIWVAFLFIMCFQAKAQYISLDQKNGFRDLKFGVAIETVSGLAPYAPAFADKAIPEMKEFTRPSDKLEIGPYQVFNITYSFYKNRLFKVTIAVNKGYQSQGVKDVLIREYGQGQIVNGIGMAWLGQVATMGFSDWQSEWAFVTIANKAIDDEYDYAKRASFKPVPSGL